MNKHRPVFLNLTQMRFPLTAIVSILHRISGVFIFIMLPWLMCLLHHTLVSADSFNAMLPLGGVAKFFLWLTLAAAGYHLVAGIRHIFMDMGFAESFKAATRTAAVMLIIAIALAIYMGVLVW